MIALMSRCALAAFSASLVLGVALVGASGAAAAGPALPLGWTHISVNVIIRGVPHTLVYDRGRIVSVGGASLTLRERDGSVWTINVSPTARITLDGQLASLSQARRRETATTLSIDGGAATKVSIVIPPALAAAPARRRRA